MTIAVATTPATVATRRSAEPVIEFTVTMRLTSSQARRLQAAIYKSARLPESLVDELVNSMDLQERAARRA